LMQFIIIYHDGLKLLETVSLSPLFFARA